jgi:acetoin utilization protein AcuB
VPLREYFIRDVMSTPVVSIEPTTALMDAALLMRSKSIRHLPVVEDHNLVGLLTDRDVQRCSPSRLLPVSEETYNLVFADTTVEKVMTRLPLTVSSSNPLIDALSLMQESKCGCIPVVDDGTLVGIITRGDLLEILHRVLSGKGISRFEEQVDTNSSTAD